MSVPPAAAESSLRCVGCGAGPGPGEPYPFRCPNFGQGDVEHVLVRRLAPAVGRHPVDPAEPNPFVRYRHRLHSYHRATAGGIADQVFVDTVRRLDERVAKVDGRGFEVTPFAYSTALSEALGFAPPGGIWVKDETVNVSGSHKGRHLMGILLHLEVSEMLGLASRHDRPVLSVASCGNAALAAAVVAAAGERGLRVFVPVDANPEILERLRVLGAEVVVCERSPGEKGDPTYNRLEEDLAAGAVPFTCQGNLNGLAIEGGETLGYEVATAMRDQPSGIDHLVVQVGGGALASSCFQALGEAQAFGEIGALPRIHTVQTESAHPLERAYRRVLADMEGAPSGGVPRALERAARRRSAYMWPWEETPKSVATGILDDETYDWLAVVGGMLTSGGVPVVADEEALILAHELAEQCGYMADATGTAGLAGLTGLLDDGEVGAEDRVLLLFTGTERS
jgi:threonine synthase